MLCFCSSAAPPFPALSSISFVFSCNLRGSLAPALRTRSSVLRGASHAWQAQGVGAVAEEGAKPLLQSVKCLPVPYGAGQDWCLPQGSGYQRVNQWGASNVCSEMKEMEDCGFYKIGGCWNFNAVCKQGKDARGCTSDQWCQCKHISSPERGVGGVIWLQFNPRRPLRCCLQGIWPQPCNRARPFPAVCCRAWLMDY